RPSDLRDGLEAELALHDLGEHLRSVRAPFGLLQTLRNNVDLMPRGDDEQWRAVVARVAAVPQMLRSWRASLAAGADRGLVAARRQAVEAAAPGPRHAH